MIPDKPKDKWINAKNYSWFFEYEPDSSYSEEEWFTRMKVSCGMIMQTLADEAEQNGIEIIRCKDCAFCEYYKVLKGNYCNRSYSHGEGSIFKIDSKNDFCSRAERKSMDEVSK